MAYRSPPPHRSSSGNRGGRSDFERAQRGLQQTIERAGFDKMPINDETLRPFLKVLWNFAKAHDERVWTFDTPSDGPPGRLFHGLVGGVTIIHPLSKALQAKLLKEFPRNEIERAKPVIQLQKGGQMAVYFSGVWTPIAALDNQTH